MTPERWILVTGAPRSSTTFVGSVLSFPREVDYIHEPFNPECGMKGFRVRYPYTCQGCENEAEIDKWVTRLLTYDFKLQTVYYPTDSSLQRLVKRVCGGRGVYYRRLARINPFSEYALIKDPFACLLADYLSRAHGVKSLILVRHPVAFVASVTRLGWDITKGLRAIAAKPNLLESYFQGEEHLLEPGATIIESAARLWRALNKVVLRQAAENPCLKVLTHEALNASPVAQFKELYDWAGLPWRQRYCRRIAYMTSGGNRVEAKSLRQDFKRDSNLLLALRLGQMSKEESYMIWQITADVASALYQQPG